MKLFCSLAENEFHRVSHLVQQQGKLDFQLSFSPEECEKGYYLLIVAVWNVLLERASNSDMLVVLMRALGRLLHKS